jgi:hypothetical protein
MTLAFRNRFFLAGIILASVSLIIIIAVSFVIIPVYPQIMEGIARRSAGFLQSIVAKLLKPASYIPFFTMLCAVIYALLTMAIVYFFFEKTQCPEIFFIALFIISFIFEAIRIILPLKFIYNLPTVYLTMTMRVLLFGRHFGVFSLFAASVCAAGLHVQKQRNILIFIVAAATVIALGAPIDSLSWDSSFTMIIGYTPMLMMIEAGIALITVLSFLVSAYFRSSREFIYIGAGSFMVFWGRAWLLNADTWLTPFLAIAFLAVGTWFICTQLHKIYLWM